MRPEASLPVSRATTGHPVRSPQTLNCSIAAARNVSPAASITFFPSKTNCCANLPMVVVLPVPLTPTTSTMWGRFSVLISNSTATGAKISAISSASIPRISSASISRSMRRLAKPSARRAAFAGPKSAVIRTSSSSSIAVASRRRRVKTPAIPSTRRDDDFESPAFKRLNHPPPLMWLAWR